MDRGLWSRTLWEIRSHRWYLFTFPLWGLPVAFATIWPTLTHKSIPEWLADHNWPKLSILIMVWCSWPVVIAISIVVRSLMRAFSSQENEGSSEAVSSMQSMDKTPTGKDQPEIDTSMYPSFDEASTDPCSTSNQSRFHSIPLVTLWKFTSDVTYPMTWPGKKSPLLSWKFHMVSIHLRGPTRLADM